MVLDSGVDALDVDLTAREEVLVYAAQCYPRAAGRHAKRPR